MIELYNNNIVDLLNDDNSFHEIKKDTQTNLVHVTNLKEPKVNNAGELFNI